MARGRSTSAPTENATAPPAASRALAAFLSDIKLEHSLFALPFAFIGALAAVHLDRGRLDARIVALVLVCMIAARTAAMGFNRWLDAPLDADNPRTAGRAIPAGRLARGRALAFVLVAAAIFLAASAAINSLCGLLAPVALVVILGYSTAKRWTSLAHILLGLALALAPGGGWVAVTGSVTNAGAVDLVPLALMLAVIGWVAGFDVLYALMDIEFDRARGLFSIPARFGEHVAYLISRGLHLMAVSALVAFGNAARLGAGWFIATAVTTACLIAEQILARDRRRIPVAFFNINATIGFILLAGIAWDMLSA